MDSRDSTKLHPRPQEETPRDRDGLREIAAAIVTAARHLGTGDAMTSMGAIEAFAAAARDSLDGIAAAVADLAAAVREHGGGA